MKVNFGDQSENGSHRSDVRPKSEFLDALGLFSVSLDGTFGDEGARLTTERLKRGTKR